MTDITKCYLEECPRKANCYRYRAPCSMYMQSYFMSPKEDCMDKDFEMQIPLKKLDQIEKIT